MVFQRKSGGKGNKSPFQGKNKKPFEHKSELDDQLMKKTPKGKQSLGTPKGKQVSFHIPGKNTPANKTPKFFAEAPNSGEKKLLTPGYKGTTMKEFQGIKAGFNRPKNGKVKDEDSSDDDEEGNEDFDLDLGGGDDENEGDDVEDDDDDVEDDDEVEMLDKHKKVMKTNKEEKVKTPKSEKVEATKPGKNTQIVKSEATSSPKKVPDQKVKDEDSSDDDDEDDEDFDLDLGGGDDENEGNDVEEEDDEEDDDEDVDDDDEDDDEVEMLDKHKKVMKTNKEEKVKTPKSEKVEAAKPGKHTQVVKSEAKSSPKKVPDQKVHQAIANQMEKTREKYLRTLYIGNLPLDIKPEEIKALSPDILEVILPKGNNRSLPKKRRTLYALVVFISEEKAEANYADLQEKELRGDKFTINFAGEKGLICKPYDPNRYNLKKLFIRRFPSKITIDKLAEIFPKSYMITLTSTNCARVSFATVDEAAAGYKACREAIVEGTRLSVKYEFLKSSFSPNKRKEHFRKPFQKKMRFL